MKKKLCTGMIALTGFALWTMAVCHVDVQPIGPMASEVGFASLNGWFHELTGVHMGLYILTDWLSLIPVAVVLGSGLMGLFQWVKRKRIWNIDRSILVLGGFYAAVFAFFVLFEAMEINYRPVLIEGVLEASYPSSTTLLVLTVMPAAGMELGRRLKNSTWILWANHIYTGFMAAARVLSGVHWITDIIGGVLLSVSLISFYSAFTEE